jgi:hypothetical protein
VEDEEEEGGEGTSNVGGEADVGSVVGECVGENTFKRERERKRKRESVLHHNSITQHPTQHHHTAQHPTTQGVFPLASPHRGCEGCQSRRPSMREEESNRETYIHICTIARFWKRETREKKREKRDERDERWQVYQSDRIKGE